MKRIVLPVLLAAALPAADYQVGTQMNNFTVEAYQHVANGDANAILSPFNIATALSMALAGARGKTADEMRSVLHVKGDAGYDAALSGLLGQLNQAGNTGGNQLLTANALWVQKGFAIQPEFANTLTGQFKAPPASIDFVANPDAARNQINSWTAEKTKNKIQDLFAAGSLDSTTRLVLTSAIYFYGKWQDPFQTSRTQPAPFTLPGGAKSQANFMNQTGHFGYTETANAQILEMRYAGTGMAFDVLLPKTADGLAALQKAITNEQLTGWLGNLSSRTVQVSLPKFRVESEYSLGRTLSAMGMPTAFTDHANFDGIAPDQRLAISEVVHKAFVDVSEEGTEAAAATGVAIHATAMLAPEPPVVFKADHPFLFLIRDTNSKTILFIGALNNPK